MRKINVIMRNEDIDAACVTDKVVVIINALFSTSAIIHALAQGAEAVHVHGFWQAAKQAATGLGFDRCVFVEPPNAEAQSRFPNHYALAMDSSALMAHSLVLTCRATSEALYLAGTAAHLYIAALLNAPAIVARLLEHEGQPLELICTAPGGRPNLVDLYAAGYLVDNLMQQALGTWVYSDSALMARAIYRQYCGHPEHCIDDSLAATLLTSEGLDGIAKHICDVGRLDIVAHLHDGALVNSQNLRWAPTSPQTRTQHHGL